MEIAGRYASLVRDETLRRRVYKTIRNEFDRSVRFICLVTGQGALLDNNPVLQKSIRLRNPYVDPLSGLQVELLKRLRALPSADGPAEDLNGEQLRGQRRSLRAAVLLSINGVAAGMKNTG
jgi:phosphoenolpyruvate carboxylase